MEDGATRRPTRRRGVPQRSLFDASRTSTELDRFGWLLILVVVALSAQMLVDASGSFVKASLLSALSGSVLVLAARAAGLQHRLCRVVDVAVAAVLLFNIALALIDVATGERLSASRLAVPGLVWLATTVLVPIVVARRLATHRVVTVQTVLGAVAAYLQIGVAYAFVYQLVEQWQPDSMFGHHVPTSAFTYFSLATITTTGYGDLVPTTELARLVAMSEAVVGQVFLVTFVAIIVARFAGGTNTTILGSAGSAPGPDDDQS